MNYEESLKFIHERAKFGIKPGTKRMEWMLKKLGSPQQNINGVHVVGTNGKGSTVSYLRNALNFNDYTVGTFTSPYIETFNERISVDGLPISNEEISQLVQIVKPISEAMEVETEYGIATEFEIITTMMFVYFGKIHPVDFVLVEAGLGAKNDSTNVFQPVMTILTSIGMDHMDILGDSLLDITKDKAGVIKPNVPLIFNVQNDDCRDYINNVLEEKSAKGIGLNRDIIIMSNEREFHFQYGAFDLQDIRLTLVGEHQKQNASLAIAALIEMQSLGYLKLNLNKMIAGIEDASWPGRIELIQKDPTIILDGAHNQESVEALVHTMNQLYPNRKITVLFSAVEGKPLSKMTETIGSLATEFFVTEFDFYRALPIEKLYQTVKHHEKNMVVDYIDFINNFKGDVLLITGSLYFISEVRHYFKSNES